MHSYPSPRPLCTTRWALHGRLRCWGLSVWRVYQFRLHCCIMALRFGRIVRFARSLLLMSKEPVCSRFNYCLLPYIICMETTYEHDESCIFRFRLACIIWIHSIVLGMTSTLRRLIDFLFAYFVLQSFRKSIVVFSDITISGVLAT